MPELCKICNKTFSRLMLHFRLHHPDQYEQECVRAMDLFKSGLTLREIVSSGKTCWKFGAALNNMLKENGIDTGKSRIKRIKNTVNNKIQISKGNIMTSNTIPAPYDSANSSNPWLLNKPSHPPLKDTKGNPLTAEYIWGKSGQDRIDLLNWVFSYYRAKGYPLPILSDSELQSEYDKLKSKNPSCVITNGTIINSNATGLNIAKHFTGPLFLNAKGGKKTKSCMEVFNDDESFKKVLRNRMGWAKSKEDGTDRPYVFAIDDDMITQGMRSSGLAYSVSHFKPMIAKYIYSKYNVKKTIDYSSGWGARCVAALSLGIEYYGIDPLTSGKINEMIKYFNGFGKAVDGCSEKLDYSVFPSVDLSFSSPPFFDLEIYAEDDKQSSHYTNYNEWLEKYWTETVKKCYNKSNYFSFMAVEKVSKNNLLDDMKSVCEKEGGTFAEAIPVKTSTNHLSNKKTTGRVSKKTEFLIVYKV